MGGNQDKDRWLEISNDKESTTILKRREWWPQSILSAVWSWAHHVSEKQCPDHLSRQSCVVSGLKQNVNVRMKPGL